jgi:hypothetical protein
VVSAGSGTATITFRTYEPVFASPLNYCGANQKALIGINNFNLIYQLDNSMERVWSYTPKDLQVGGIYNPLDIKVKFASIPTLHMVYLTPKDTLYVNPVQRWPYYNLLKQTKTVGRLGPLNPNGSTYSSFPSDVIQLSGIPSKIYIFARRANNERKANIPDCYARIENLKMYFNNQDGIFSQCSPEALYHISQENGIDVPYHAWYHTLGGVFCADLAKDIPTANTEAVGSSEQIQLQYSVDITNLGTDTPDFTLFTIILYEGILTNDRTIVTREQNIISIADMVTSKQLPNIPYRPTNGYNGSGFDGSGIRDYVRHGVKAVKDAAEYIAHDLPQAKEFASDVYNEAKNIGKASYSAAKMAFPQYAPMMKMIEEVYNVAAPVASCALAQYMKADGYTEEQAFRLLMANGGQYVKTKTKKAQMKKPTARDGGKTLTKAELKKLLN